MDLKMFFDRVNYDGLRMYEVTEILLPFTQSFSVTRKACVAVENSISGQSPEKVAMMRDASMVIQLI